MNINDFIAEAIRVVSGKFYSPMTEGFLFASRRHLLLSDVNPVVRGVILALLFEWELHDELEKRCKAADISYERIDNSVGDYKVGGIPWELKTRFADLNSANKKGELTYTYQGSTHSNKCPNFIFFAMGLDINKPLSTKPEENKEIFDLDSRFLVVGNNIGKYLQWKGQPTKKNSRTTLYISAKDAAKVEKHCYFGKIAATRKWAHCRNEIE